MPTRMTVRRIRALQVAVSHREAYLTSRILELTLEKRPGVPELQEELDTLRSGVTALRDHFSQQAAQADQQVLREIAEGD